MKNPVSLGLVLSAVVCLAYGCGSDDDDTASPHAGAAGKGGSGAKGGAGGSGSKAGSAGNGATSGSGAKGGQGGTSGKGGAGRGGAGRGGAGRGGDTGGGGEAGHCAAEQPPDLLAVCPALPDPDDQRSVTTTCSFEDTCRALDCGGTWSPFDASGCRKPTCSASSACDSGERCVSAVLLDNWDCYSSIYEGCEVSDCSCSCSATEDCMHPSFCQPANVLPDTFECPVASVGCFDIDTLLHTLESYTNGLDQDSLSDADQAVIACEHAAQQKLESCPGHGGEGGAGAGGGGAGGQSGAGQSGGGHGGA